MQITTISPPPAERISISFDDLSFCFFDSEPTNVSEDKLNVPQINRFLIIIEEKKEKIQD